MQLKSLTNRPSKSLFSLILALLFAQSITAQLVINEIMFNDGSNNEFVEIYNNSAGSVSLSGWSLDVDGSSRALTGTIGANSYVIVFHTSSSNAGTYFTINTNLGYSFLESVNNTLPANLDNTSSTLTLLNGGSTEDVVTYSSSWASSDASGTGNSLVLNSPSDDNSSSSNWSSSSYSDGSFGGQNFAISCFGTTCNGDLSDLSSSIDLLQVSGSQSIDQDLSIDQIIVSSGATLELEPTGNTGHHLSLTSAIENDGTFAIGHNCTVLQTSTSSNSGSGSYEFSRSGDNDALVYNIWGSPVTDVDILTTFTSANPCDIFAFNSSDQTYRHDYVVPFSTTCNGNNFTFNSGHLLTDPGYSNDGLFDIGRGYFAPGSATLTLRTFSGSNLNNGSVTEAVQINGTGATDSDDWNLISNPYPSGVDAEDFINANTNIQAALYFWNPSSSGAGSESDFQVWTTLGSIGNTLNGGSIIDALAGNHIAAGQGFFVEANTAGNVSFNNSMRTSTSNQFFKNENVFDDDKERVWLSFKSEDNQISKQILLGLADDATLGKDRLYDARTNEGSLNMAFYMINQSENFSIQGQPKLEVGDERIIPLGYNNKFAGIHSISIDTTINWLENVDVFLKDDIKSSYTNLKNEVYYFYADLDRDEERFSLVLRKKEDINTSIKDQVSTENIVRKMESENQLIIESSDEIINEYVIYDIAGKLVESKYNSDNKLTIETSRFTKGLYLLKVNFGNNSEKVLKFVKQ